MAAILTRQEDMYTYNCELSYCAAINISQVCKCVSVTVLTGALLYIKLITSGFSIHEY